MLPVMAKLKRSSACSVVLLQFSLGPDPPPAAGFPAEFDAALPIYGLNPRFYRPSSAAATGIRRAQTSTGMSSRARIPPDRASAA